MVKKGPNSALLYDFVYWLVSAHYARFEDQTLLVTTGKMIYYHTRVFYKVELDFMLDLNNTFLAVYGQFLKDFDNFSQMRLYFFIV